MTSGDRMARAEDYVFGLMSEEERARAERDMEVDAEFRNCVMILGEQLRRLREEPNVPVSIPDEAWREISQRIAAMPHLAGAETAARMAGMTPQASSQARPGLLRMRRPFARQFAGWRGTAVAGAVAAALLVGYLVGRATGPVPSPLAVAVLAAADGTNAALIEEYPGNRLRILPLAPFDVPEGKVLQIWAGAVPVGVLGRAAETTLLGPDMPAPQAGHPYSITLEDGPATRPQGPTLASGEAVVPPR